jgi:hypothetical protein
MPRPRNALPVAQVEITLPEDELGKVKLYLISATTGKVPQGAYQSFFRERIHEFFEWGSLDLAPYFVVPAGTIVRAPKATVEILKRHLEALVGHV